LTWPASDVSDEGTRIESLSFNGKPVDAKDQNRFATFLDISLKNNPLAPKSSATFTVKWSYILPAAKGSARECVCDSTSFFVSYFYPQIAVYDDLNGWASVTRIRVSRSFTMILLITTSRSACPPGFRFGPLGNGKMPSRRFHADLPLDRWEKAHTSNGVAAIFRKKSSVMAGLYKSKSSGILFRFQSRPTCLM
jgi:hypothetical protein